MAKVIEFYVPARFRKVVKWVPQQGPRYSNRCVGQTLTVETRWTLVTLLKMQHGSPKDEACFQYATSGGLPAYTAARECTQKG
jgi:hypothetical protein